MYGQERYGRGKYGGLGDTAGEQKDYYKDLTKLVPEFVAEKTEMRELYVIQGYEVGYLLHIMEDVVNQCFVMTATWGLDRWERLFGIATNMSLSLEHRREIIMAKLRGQGTTTVRMIQEAAAAFSGGEVDVIEDNPGSRFTVRFIGIKGIPRNMQGFISMLEEIKPAHLAYDFEYRYTIWDEMVAYTWNGLLGMKWNDTRTLKEA